MSWSMASIPHLVQETLPPPLKCFIGPVKSCWHRVCSLAQSQRHLSLCGPQEMETSFGSVTAQHLRQKERGRPARRGVHALLGRPPLKKESPAPGKGLGVRNFRDGHRERPGGRVRISSHVIQETPVCEVPTGLPASPAHPSANFQHWAEHLFKFSPPQMARPFFGNS